MCFEQERQMQELLNSSLTERNAWFHKYSKSNLSQRKRKILNIHEENKKIVKRLIDIKPHPDFIQLAKEIKPLEISNQGNPNKSTLLNNNTSANFLNSNHINTLNNQKSKDYVRENKQKANQDSFLLKANLLQNHQIIPREKSSLSFVTDQLDIINEIPNSRGNQLLHGNLTQRNFRRKDNIFNSQFKKKLVSDSNLITSQNNFMMQDNSSSSRPTTTTTVMSAFLQKRPQSSLFDQGRSAKDFNNQPISGQDISSKQFKIPLHKLKSTDNYQNFDSQMSSSQKAFGINNHRGDTTIIQENQNLSSINMISSFLNSKDQSKTFELQSCDLRNLPESSRFTEPKIILNSTQKKSISRFKQLLDAQKTQNIPKEVSTTAFTSKSKFIQNQIDSENYQQNREIRLQRRMSEHQQRLQSLDQIKTYSKFIKVPNYGAKIKATNDNQTID